MIVGAQIKALAPEQFQTEAYVSMPPARWIINEQGDVFTLGIEMGPQSDWPNGQYGWQVLVDHGQGAVATGCVASQLERRNRQVRAFTRQGWRIWNGRTFT